MKIWHIWDFPDNIYIKFNKDFNNKLFNFLFKKFGGKRPTARKFNMSQMRIKTYHRQYFKKGGRIYDQYMPLYILKRFKPEINDNLISELEDNIEYFRVWSGISIKIKLPITESPEMYRIVAHMVGDGFAGERKVPYYANTCLELRSQFKNDLIAVFGKDIKKHIYETIPNTTPIVNFPRVLSEILKCIFQVNFTKPNLLPHLLFETSNHNKAVFIRALFDDEGYVSTTIGISMKSKKIIQQIQNLLGELGVGTTNISKKQEQFFTINISEKMVEKFKEKIGFDHPIKKNRLETRIKIKERNRTLRTRPLEHTRKEIIRLLKEKPRSTFELCNILLFTVTGLYRHLNFLEDNNIIERTGFKNKAIWKVKV
ncbi:MAG: LAGLIDADG family homing endonuclease [Nanoarchaeota archaeon]